MTKTSRVLRRQLRPLDSAMPTHIEAVIVTHVTVRHAAVFSLIGVPASAPTSSQEKQMAKRKATPISGKRGRREPVVYENGE